MKMPPGMTEGDFRHWRAEYNGGDRVLWSCPGCGGRYPRHHLCPPCQMPAGGAWDDCPLAGAATSGG